MSTSVQSSAPARGRDDRPEIATGGVHLVGSVPLTNPEEVFRTVATSLGDRLRRIPDGETGPRSDWIVWQYPVLSALPQFEVGPPGPDHYRALPKLRVRDGERVEAIRFGSLGYARSEERRVGKECSS